MTKEEIRPEGLGFGAVEPILQGVSGISFGYVNAFVLTQGELTLIDSGTPRGLGRVRRSLERAGGSAALRHVLVTHHHMDHVGPLAAIAVEGVTVWAHPLDARVIGGDAQPTPASRNAIERAGVWAVEHLAPKGKPARVDRELSDGEEIPIGDGLIACHTPGHTAGHVSFLMPSKRVLFVGDAAANYLGRLGPPFGLYNEDHDEVRKSIAKLAALDFDIACFGHGRVLTGEACVKFRKLAEKLVR